MTTIRQHLIITASVSLTFEASRMLFRILLGIYFICAFSGNGHGFIVTPVHISPATQSSWSGCPRPALIMYCSSCCYAPRHSKNGGGALSVTPVRACVRPSVIKIWCPLNNFWKTASIQFKFSMLIYNIKTQDEFDLGYNLLIFDGVMGLL